MSPCATYESLCNAGCYSLIEVMHTHLGCSCGSVVLNWLFAGDAASIWSTFSSRLRFCIGVLALQQLFWSLVHVQHQSSCLHSVEQGDPCASLSEFACCRFCCCFCCPEHGLTVMPHSWCGNVVHSALWQTQLSYSTRGNSCISHSRCDGT